MNVKDTAGRAGGFIGSKHVSDKLFILVSVLSQSLLPLMGRNLMSLSFSSARHNSTPYDFSSNTGFF